MRIITFGTFDLFHIGHLNIIKRSKNYKGEKNYLVVGVSSDELNYFKKKKKASFNENDRMEIVRSLKYVDEVFLEESLEKKLEYCLKYKADVLIMGDDHIGKFDYLIKHNIKVIYLSRTSSISTSEIIAEIKEK